MGGMWRAAGSWDETLVTRARSRHLGSLPLTVVKTPPERWGKPETVPATIPGETENHACGTPAGSGQNCPKTLPVSASQMFESTRSNDKPLPCPETGVYGQ